MDSFERGLRHVFARCQTTESALLFEQAQKDLSGFGVAVHELVELGLLLLAQLVVEKTKRQLLDLVHDPSICCWMQPLSWSRTRCRSWRVAATVRPRVSAISAKPRARS